MTSSVSPKDTAVLIASESAEPLHIASIMAQVRPEYIADIKAWLRIQPGVEVHAEDDQGKLVLVVETENERNILTLLDEFTAQPGALNAALVYHEILTGD